MSLAGCRPARVARRCRATAGFTLIEILVVLAVVAVLLTIATLSLGALAGRGVVDGELLRLEARLGLARQRAVLEGRELGIAFSRRGYAFVAYEEGAWRALGDDVLAARSLQPEVALALRLEGAAVDLPAGGGDAVGAVAREQGGDEDTGPVPQVLVLSDGSVTPFDLELRDAPSGRSGWLEVSMLGEVRQGHHEGAGAGGRQDRGKDRGKDRGQDRVRGRTGGRP
jgi:general secretion pathway protein H